MIYRSRLLLSQPVTHDVRQFLFEKPAGFAFRPGQAVMMSLDRPGLEDEQRPFSPTSLNEDDVLQFTIKRYPERHGITDKLHELRPGDFVLFTEPSGDIVYRGPGLFIAGGAGITPFLSILRQLHHDGQLDGNSLVYSNKRHEDIIAEHELESYLPGRCLFTLTREDRLDYPRRRIDQAFLAEQVTRFDQEFYICGPLRFVHDVSKAIQAIGVQASHLVLD
ncbi:MAG: FAD-binding oxidoreductase [Phycisphaerae bacterium]|nr:FAD-binding oxidoreductase [Phycisphaerae bacterium]